LNDLTYTVNIYSAYWYAKEQLRCKNYD